MLIQILRGTPAWVFVLFLGLLALGYQQTRPRTVGVGRLLILPVGFVAFSFYGAVTAFGAEPHVVVGWAAGIGAALLFQRIGRSPTTARWDPSAGAFHIPGSWIPMALMMTVFFIRYILTVTMALNPHLAGETAFGVAVSLLYGLLSGAFVGRALKVLATRGTPSAHSVQST